MEVVPFRKEWCTVHELMAIAIDATNMVTFPRGEDSESR